MTDHTPSPDLAELMKRLREVEYHNWRESILAHVCDTAREARLALETRAPASGKVDDAFKKFFAEWWKHFQGRGGNLLIEAEKLGLVDRVALDLTDTAAAMLAASPATHTPKGPLSDLPPHAGSKWAVRAAGIIARMHPLKRTIEAAAAVIDREVKSAPSTDLEVWIAKEFGGLGRAIRRETAAAYPGEPYMSMEDAKTLTRRAVAAFATPSTDGKAEAHVIESNRDTGTAGSLREIVCACGLRFQGNWNTARHLFDEHIERHTRGVK